MIQPPKAKASQASLAFLLGMGTSRVIGEKSLIYACKEAVTDTRYTHIPFQTHTACKSLWQIQGKAIKER